MSTDAATVLRNRPAGRPLSLPSYWPLVLGLLAMAVPTIATLAGEPWTTDTGAHGPIVLATGLWLLHHDGLRMPRNGEATGNWTVALPFLIVAFAAYIVGRAFDFVSIEFIGLYGAFIAVVVRLSGLRALRRHAFPLFYLFLAIPPPGAVMTMLTSPLQNFVSWSGEHISRGIGLPVAREGVVLFVGPYQLLVEDACAGLNSMFGLVAISLLYIFLAHRASWRHALVLTLAVIPIAIVVNVLRVMGLILISYYMGDAAAQGFLHSTTGLVMFAAGLLLVIALDRQLVARFRFAGAENNR